MLDDSFRYKRGLSLGVVCLVVSDFLALAELGSCEQSLWQPLAIVFDDLVGSLENRLSRAIVLFEFYGLCAGKIMLKSENDIEVRTSKGIDALVDIADDT